MKKIIICLLLLGGIGSVNANSHYVNNNGVEFTNNEYEYISNLYYDGYQDDMSIDEYNRIKESNLFNQKVYSNYKGDSGISLMSTKVTSYGRTLKISKSCTGDECLVTLVATWNIKPDIGSYDVIGFRTPNDSITVVNKATAKGDNYSYTSNRNSAVSFSNGFGHSVKISTVKNLKVSTSMYCRAGVTVYGAYEHTLTGISQANSKLFTIGSGGNGNVFNFYGKASSVYSNSPGVSISL